MKLLLDSHTLLWLMQGSSNLSSLAVGHICNPANELYLSMASIWEFAIKIGLKKMGLSAPFATFVTTVVESYGLSLAPITIGDCIGYESLTFLSKAHRDPFDRMIAVQAQRNSMSVVSNDAAFDLYGVSRLW